MTFEIDTDDAAARAELITLVDESPDPDDPGYHDHLDIVVPTDWDHADDDKLLEYLVRSAEIHIPNGFPTEMFIPETVRIIPSDEYDK